MDIQTMYSKIEQLWKMVRAVDKELSEELRYKKLRCKKFGVVGDFYDTILIQSDKSPAVHIIIIDEDGGKYRGKLEDFEVLR